MLVLGSWGGYYGASHSVLCSTEFQTTQAAVAARGRTRQDHQVPKCCDQEVCLGIDENPLLVVCAEHFDLTIAGLHSTVEKLYETSRTLFIPVVLGTARMGRMSLHAAWLVTEELGDFGTLGGFSHFVS
jgi:hypothetical protein